MTTPRSAAPKRWRLPLLIAAALGCLWLVLIATGPGRMVLSQLAELIEAEPALGGPFSLVDTAGKTVTDKDFTGKPFAVFFGFTHCPDICPTTLADMGDWLKGLGADADRIKLTMITVDPERDTPAALAAYMTAFDPRITAMTGSRLQIDAVLLAYRAYAKKVETGGGEYTVDHSAPVYLMDASGRFWSVVSRSEGTDGVIAKLKKLIDGG